MKPNTLSQSFFHRLGDVYVGSVAPKEKLIVQGGVGTEQIDFPYPKLTLVSG